MTQWLRTWRVTVGTLRVSEPMRVAFEIERSVRPTPGKAVVRIWNLARDHQAQIEQAAGGQVVIEAGHRSARGLVQLFRGELVRARGGDQALRSTRDGLDVVTRIEARDGGRAYQGARISQSFEPGVSVATVLRACADSLGVGEGNLRDALAAQLEAGGDRYPEGTILSGQAAHELTRILDGLGMRWSVQHGALQVLRVGRAMPAQAVRLTPGTGLVGSPEVGTRGRVKVRALLSADIAPGRPVVLESERARGRYVVRAVKYSGDSHAQDAYVDAELATETA